MLKSNIKKVLLYGGIDHDDFDSIRPMVWQRNLHILHITAWMAAGIGLLFLVINHFLHSNTQIPYLVLLVCSILTLCLLQLFRKKI